MTLTLELTPEVETRLHELAALHGQTEEDYALRALDAQTLAQKKDLEESVAAIRQSMADFAAGRSYSLEECVAKAAAHRQIRRVGSRK
jgi:predicted transcriptional regulator